MSNNIFQDIIDKKVPADIVYEDEWVVAFAGISVVKVRGVFPLRYTS